MTAVSMRRLSFARLPRPGRGALMALLLALVVIGAAALRVEAAGDRAGQASADERAYVRLAGDLRTTGTYGGPTWPTRSIGRQGRRPCSRPPTRSAAMRSPAASTCVPPATPRPPWACSTVAAAFALAALIAGAWAGVAAAVAVAFYPPMISATTQLTSELLGALAVTAALAAVAWAWSRGRAAGFAAAGAAVGLACLVRADVLPAALVLGPAVGLLHARRATWRTGVVAGAATLLGVLAIVGPWCAWASRREQRFVPITDGGTATLFVGTYLPGHGTIFGLKHAVAKEAMRRAPVDPPQGRLPPAREGLPRCSRCAPSRG